MPQSFTRAATQSFDTKGFFWACNFGERELQGRQFAWLNIPSLEDDEVASYGCGGLSIFFLLLFPSDLISATPVQSNQSHALRLFTFNCGRRNRYIAHWGSAINSFRTTSSQCQFSARLEVTSAIECNGLIFQVHPTDFVYSEDVSRRHC